MFTKQHYEAIAEVLKANKPERLLVEFTYGGAIEWRALCRQHRTITDGIAYMLAFDNPQQFARDWFLEACGY